MQYCLYCNNKQKPTLGSKNCFAGVCAIHIHNLFELAVGVKWGQQTRTVREEAGAVCGKLGCCHRGAEEELAVTGLSPRSHHRSGQQWMKITDMSWRYCSNTHVSSSKGQHWLFPGRGCVRQGQHASCRLHLGCPRGSWHSPALTQLQLASSCNQTAALTENQGFARQNRLWGTTDFKWSFLTFCPSPVCHLGLQTCLGALAFQTLSSSAAWEVCGAVRSSIPSQNCTHGL